MHVTRYAYFSFRCIAERKMQCLIYEQQKQKYLWQYFVSPNMDINSPANALVIC